MNARGLVTLVLLCGIAANPSYGQETSSLVRFEHITVDQGLPSNYIHAILQDKRGFIWIGTRQGLTRYDGYNLFTYKNDPFNLASLSDSHVLALLEDSQGHLWVATNRGLNRFDRRTGSFVRFLHDANDPNTISNNFLSSLIEDSSGRIWVGTAGGLNLLDRESGRFTRYLHDPEESNSLSHNHVLSIAEDRQGTIWVGTAGGGLNRLDPDSGKFHVFRHAAGNPTTLGTDFVSAVRVDRRGVLWAASFGLGGMLHSLDPGTGGFRSYPYPSVVEGRNVGYSTTDILENEDGTFWITTTGVNEQNNESGVHLFDPRTGRFVTYTFNASEPNSLTWGWAYAVYRDRSGTLWVGTSRGLNKYDPGQRKFGLWKREPGNAFSLTDNVYSIYEDETGGLWIGTTQALTRFDRSTGTFRQIDRKAPPGTAALDVRVYALAGDQNGTLWIGTSAWGLERMDLQTGRITRHLHDPSDPGSIPSDGIAALHVGRDGGLWVGTDRGFGRLDLGTGRFKNYLHDPQSPGGLSGNKVMAIFEDRDGIVWVGTNNLQNDATSASARGLNRLDPRTGTFTLFKHRPGDSTSLGHDGINVILEDRAGHLWIGTDNGLNRFDRESQTFRAYLEEDGLADGRIVGIVEDESGKLWIATEGNGLGVFDPETGRFRNYDTSDGLQNRRFNPGAYFRSPGGEIFFGGVGGVNSFYAETVADNPQIPPVVFTAFQASGQPVRLDRALQDMEEIPLRWSNNQFSFEFAALSYRSPEKNQYAYKLEGFDTDWVYSGTRRYVSYTNLSPGTYVLRVRASNNDGVWNEEGVAVRIRVLPPWWRTWWAYGFYLALLAGGVYGADRFQRRRLVIRERTRAEIRETKLRAEAAERELEQAREIEKAYEELKRTQAQLVQQEKLASLGALTAGIAHEIKNPLNFINNFAELDVELVRELREEAESKPETRLKDVDDVLADLEQNATKIADHGRRADGIVRSMLDHSRGSSDVRQPTDLNALLDEYANLAYHGMRAQKTSFDCTLEKQLDPMLPPVVVMPQDIGRVFLNLLSNAFQAVHERARSAERGKYRAAIHLSTAVTAAGIEVRIRDNGTGIPEEVKRRIFEPFFTTKATGEGTGLGLSLSHDIIVQGHGGSIEVASEPGEGTEFTVVLPAGIAEPAAPVFLEK
jgi:ligand-binding sensor domain-containing protein/signal transduction histidine kinase